MRGHAVAVNKRIKAQVIAEWRGLPEEPFPQDTSQAVGPLIAALMKELGLSERMTEEQIISAWKEIVGDFLAGHSRPSGLHEGVLYVRVLQSTMLYELDRTFRKEILEKLRKRFGRLIRDVRFKMG
jgi:predicted nucleic acid-binding Zn ribbon protein